MYFADLTEYTYMDNRSSQKSVLNVGWLDDHHAFPKGEVPNEVLARIFALCVDPVNKTRGAHSCAFCSEGARGRVATRNGVQLSIGGAEIRVSGLSGVVYASPCMIYHYISEHHYRPPQQFIDAVLGLGG